MAKLLFHVWLKENVKDFDIMMLDIEEPEDRKKFISDARDKFLQWCEEKGVEGIV